MMRFAMMATLMFSLLTAATPACIPPSSRTARPTAHSTPRPWARCRGWARRNRADLSRRPAEREKAQAEWAERRKQEEQQQAEAAKHDAKASAKYQIKATGAIVH